MDGEIWLGMAVSFSARTEKIVSQVFDFESTFYVAGDTSTFRIEKF
jgi:hypothetical protein